MTIELRDGRTADVQPAVAVVVQLQREMRLAVGGDFFLEPPLERRVLGRELGIGRLVPIAVEIPARRLNRVPPRATPSLLAIGSTLTLY